MGGPIYNIHIIYISEGTTPCPISLFFLARVQRKALPCLPHDLADLLGVVRHEHVDAAEVSRIVAGRGATGPDSEMDKSWR